MLAVVDKRPTDLQSSYQHHDIEQTDKQDTSCGLPCQWHTCRGVDRRMSCCSELYAWRTLYSSHTRTFRSDSLQQQHQQLHQYQSTKLTTVSTSSTAGLLPINVITCWLHHLNSIHTASSAAWRRAAWRSAAQHCSNRLHCNQRQHSHRKQRRAALRSIADKIRSESD